jgi:hypothetical protein
MTIGTHSYYRSLMPYAERYLPIDFTGCNDLLCTVLFVRLLLSLYGADRFSVVLSKASTSN